MNRYHQEILNEIKRNSDPHLYDKLPKGYLGNNHPLYGIKTPIARSLAKKWAKEHSALPIHEFSDLLTSLYMGESLTEKAFAGLLLFYMPKLRYQLPPSLLNTWLSYLEGWAEIDSLCQSNFTAEELLSDWNEWKTLLLKFSESDTISKRRASLVLLTKVVHESNDSRLKDMAFYAINKLQHEKSILITKAISWLLRDLSYNYKDDVIKFIEMNKNTLPKIAIRETLKKIETGRK